MKEEKKQKIEEVVRMPVMVRKISTLSDGGIKISIHTQEVSDEDVATVFGMKNKEGWMAFKPEKPKVDDMKDLPEIPLSKKEKSPSQRMRSIIYRIWENNTAQSKPFPDFYKSYMFRLNERLKERIDG